MCSQKDDLQNWRQQGDLEGRRWEESAKETGSVYEEDPPQVQVGEIILVGLCMAVQRLASLLGAAGKFPAWAH